MALVAILTAVLLAWASVWFLAHDTLDAAQLREAQAALDRQDYHRAWTTASGILGRQPDSPEACVVAAQAAIALGRFEDAFDLWERVPDDGSSTAVQARCDAGDVLLLHNRRLADAEAQFRRALQQDPRRLNAHDHLAFALGLAGRNWELIPHRLALIEQDRIDPMHLYVLSLASSAMENPEMTAAYHRSAPDDPGPLLGLSRLAFEEQDYVQAAARARQAISLDPDLAEAHVKLGRALWQQDSDSEFAAWLAEVPASAESHPEIWALRGAAAQRRSLDELAARCYWEAVLRDANHPGANYQLGRRLVDAGRASDAQPFLDRANRLQDYVNAAKLAVNMHDVAEVRAAAEIAEQLGLVWEAYAWRRLALKIAPNAAGDRIAAARLRSQFPHERPPMRRNLAAANPALDIDLSSFPLLDWRSEWVRDGSLADSRDAVTTATAAAIRFDDQAAATGLDFRYFNGGDPTRDIRRMYEFTGGGVAVLDFDRDGWPDAYFTQGCTWPPREAAGEHLDRLFRNGDGERFVEATNSASITEAGFGQGVAAGDFDADGFTDLMVANIGANRLLRNNGDGTFSPVELPAAVSGDRWTSSCLLADVTGDGLADLYAVNYLSGDDVFTRECGELGVCLPQKFPGAADQLAVNMGNGEFAIVSQAAGVALDNGKGLGLLAADFRGRGRLDLFVANDSVANYFYRPTGSANEPRFSEEAFLTGLAMNAEGKAEACMGVASADADGDGRLDLFVTNFYLESNTLYLQDAGGAFLDATQAAGLRDPSLPMLGFGTQFLDADADGRPDLFVANGHIDDFRQQGIPFQMTPQIFRNLGGGRFAELPGGEVDAFFERPALGRAVATLDWNRDGRADLVIGHLDQPTALLTNRTRGGNALALTLHGVHAPRDAIGTTVRVTVAEGAAERTMVRQITAGDGYQSSNERQLVFGLGDEARATRVEIDWPAGQRQSLGPITAATAWIVVEGRPPWPIRE